MRSGRAPTPLRRARSARCAAGSTPSRSSQRRRPWTRRRTAVEWRSRSLALASCSPSRGRRPRGGAAPRLRTLRVPPPRRRRDASPTLPKRPTLRLLRDRSRPQVPRPPRPPAAQRDAVPGARAPQHERHGAHAPAVPRPAPKSSRRFVVASSRFRLFEFLALNFRTFERSCFEPNSSLRMVFGVAERAVPAGLRHTRPPAGRGPRSTGSTTRTTARRCSGARAAPWPAAATRARPRSTTAGCGTTTQRSRMSSRATRRPRRRDRALPSHRITRRRGLRCRKWRSAHTNY